MFSIQNSAGVQFAHFDVYIKDNEPNLTYLVSAVDMYNSCNSCEVGGDELCDPSEDDEYYPLSDPHSHGNHFEDISIRAGSPRGVLYTGVRVLLFGRRKDLQAGTPQDAISRLCTIAPEGDDDDSTLSMTELAEDMYTNNRDRWNSFLRADCHNEQHSFTDVHVSEFRDSAFVVEGRNSKGNVFENCTCDGRYAGGPDDYGDGCCGFSCVKTGQFEADNRHTPWVDNLTTSGSFHWYGGMARNISDAVFLLGWQNDTSIISGISVERARKLLHAPLQEQSSRYIFPVIVDSVNFGTAHVHAWDGVVGPLPKPNHCGIIIDFPNRGPLIVRNSSFGNCGVAVEDDQQTPEEIRFHWRYAEPDPVSNWRASKGGFLFAGNKLSSTVANPFSLQDTICETDPPDEIYPTTQMSNLQCTMVESENTYQWTPMPQHFTQLATEHGGTDEFDISRTRTSHEFFRVTGAGSVRRLTGGVPGQRIMLLAETKPWIEPEIVHSDDGEEGTIVLYGGMNFQLTDDDVLWLLMDEDLVWRELARSEN
jgi:hypothetical protein